MRLYLGKDVGDVLTITLNKYVPPIVIVPTFTNVWNSVVEATLAIVLLTKCK